MAGRIPQDFIEQLLDRTDLVELIHARVPLKRSGRSHVGLCPFHKEKSPSFNVNAERQFYYCFGCGAGGNAVSFLMDYDRLDFPQAVEQLARQAGMEVPREGGTAPSARAQQVRAHRDTLYDILREADEWYQKQLREHPTAHRATDYLKGRGLTGQVAKQFGIGYAPPGWDNLFQALGTSEARQQLLVDAGLAIEREDGRCYDRFRDRVMFPIRDSRGRVIAFGGRVLGDEKPKYLNSPETPVFEKGRELYGLFEARKRHRDLPRLLVVEGYMDVVALAQFGLDYACATLGTATGPNHMQRLFRHTHEVVFCFDGDNAGRAAAARALEAVLPSLTDGRQARFLFLPEGEDPDTLVRRLGGDALQRQVEDATPLSDFLFEHAGRGLTLDSMDGRARLAARSAPLINLLPEGVFKRLMLNALAQRTGASLSDLEHAAPLRPAESSQPDTSGRTPVKRTPLARERQRVAITPARRALTLLVHQPELGRDLGDVAPLQQLDDPDIPLLLSTADWLAKRPHTSTPALLGYFHGTPEGEFLTHLAAQDPLIQPEGAAREFMDILGSLRHLPHEQRSDQVVKELEADRSVSYNNLPEAQRGALDQLLAQLKQKHGGGRS